MHYVLESSTLSLFLWGKWGMRLREPLVYGLCKACQLGLHSDLEQIPDRVIIVIIAVMYLDDVPLCFHSYVVHLLRLMVS